MKSTGNVLLVSNYPSDTGYAWWLMEHFWRTIAEHCRPRNRITYLAYPQITTIPPRIASAPIEPVELTIPWTTRSEMEKVKCFLRERRITTIYFTDRAYLNPQYLSYRRWGVRSIIVHDHTPGDRPAVTGLKGALKAARNRLPGITADHVLCVSALMRQRSIANARIPADKCLTVQNGVPPVCCNALQRESTRRALGARASSVAIVTAGRAHPYKRFDLIIDAAAALQRRRPDLDVIFWLIGDGPAAEALERQVRDRGLQEKVRLLGFRSDVRDILCAADIAIHAARGEGFSLSIVEYMSAGLPVLVPAIPSVSQAIEHDQTGFIYADADPQAAAESLELLAANAGRRQAMGARAREVANERYSLDRCTAQLQAVIEEIL